MSVPMFYIRAFQKESLFQFTLEGGHTMINTALGAGDEKAQEIRKVELERLPQQAT